jgi:hypothetical protein
MYNKADTLVMFKYFLLNYAPLHNHSVRFLIAPSDWKIITMYARMTLAT